tara:strand:+ start:816 stop:1721 length:906 start_codon:yes stop_codon:yes gene_type:complete
MQSRRAGDVKRPEMKAPITALFVLLFGFSNSFALTAQEILEQHEQAKAEALQAYLDANPEAEDRADAVEHLIDSLTVLGDSEKVFPLLEERYAALVSVPEPDLQALLGELVPQLVDGFRVGEGKDKAREFIDRVEKDLAVVIQQNPRIGGYLQQLRGKLNMPGVGEAMDIQFTSISGDSIDLAEMKGKVVLVDFWATWCGPCIAEMPNVINAYKKHRESGFEVVGISLDQDKNALENYISEHEMTWPQYFDGKGWGNEIAGKFGIQGIPATFLIGKDGKIAATNLRGDDLEKKVTELLGDS